MDIIKEFFGWTSDRTPEGWFSWQHIIFCIIVIGFTVALGIFLGKRNKNKTAKQKRKVLAVIGTVLIANEILRIVLFSFRSGDPFLFRGMLPFFLCGVALVTVPFTAFDNKFAHIATCFISIYGMLCCVAGTVLAANYYYNNPIISFDILNSTVAHCGSGLAAVYIFSVGLLDDYDILNKDKIRYFCSPLFVLFTVILALTMNFINASSSYESNYMFLTNSAGTPFSIVETLTGGIQVLYTAAVILLYILYGVIFSVIYYAIRKKRK